MKPLLPSKPGTAYEVQRTGRTETGVDAARRTTAAPGLLVSFARFVLCGGGVGLASGPAVALLAALVPWALANALVTATSTIVSTQLHARFTFEAGRRAGWRQHWQSAGSASAGYAVTCAAMLILHMVQPSAGTLSEQAVYLSASGLAGIGRFLVLRLLVFAGSPTTVQENSPAGVQEASETESWSIATPARPKATRSASERAIKCGVRTATTASTVRANSPSGRSGRSASTPRPLHSPLRPRHTPAVAGLKPRRASQSLSRGPLSRRS
ncbi:GtrA family protein [Streptomyces olivochromogenes]|uniref:GtrA family protein n=1 Tax=Streptomyces olivochromogenes TaxID=1963 RepID=UPI0036DE7BDA